MAAWWLEGGITAFVTSGLSMFDWLNTLTFRLYVNDHDPLFTDTNLAFVEASFPGYSPVLSGPWTDGGFDINNNDMLQAPDVVNTSTGSSSDVVYGYYATDPGGTGCLAEYAGTGFPMAASGLTYTVSPRFFVGNLTPPV